jgi:hypothetical protein
MRGSREMSSESQHQDVLDLIDRARDLPPGRQRAVLEAELLRRLPGSDVINLLQSDLPAQEITDLCLRTPRPQGKLSREELLVLVRRIMAGEATSEAEDTLQVELFVENCRHPAGSDLIFYPQDVFGEQVDVTPEMIVAKALGES